jgi:hypothetical protein
MLVWQQWCVGGTRPAFIETNFFIFFFGGWRGVKKWLAHGLMREV